MATETFIERQEENISIHIFAVSAAMVGVCITVISLFSISAALRKIETLGDDLMAVDAVLFLVSCITSYMAIKTQNRQRRYRLERGADIVFLLALSLIVVVALLIVWQLF